MSNQKFEARGRNVYSIPGDLEEYTCRSDLDAIILAGRLNEKSYEDHTVCRQIEYLYKKATEAGFRVSGISMSRYTHTLYLQEVEGTTRRYWDADDVHWSEVPIVVYESDRPNLQLRVLLDICDGDSKFSSPTKEGTSL